MEQRGARGTGSILASFDISLRASTSHAPQLSPQVPLCAPPSQKWHSLQAPKWGCRVLIPPACQPTHPYFHLSGALLEERGGGFGGSRGRIPRSIPTNFLISFASMLCPKFTPLTYPPYSLSRSVPLPSRSFLCCFGQGSKSKTGVSCCLAALGTFNSIWTSRHHIRRNCSSTFSWCVSLNSNLFHSEASTSTSVICCWSYSACTNQFRFFCLPIIN